MCLIQVAQLRVLPDAPLAPLLLCLPLRSPGTCSPGQALERDDDHHSSLVHTLWEPLPSRACLQVAPNWQGVGQVAASAELQVP